MNQATWPIDMTERIKEMHKNYKKGKKLITFLRKNCKKKFFKLLKPKFRTFPDVMFSKKNPTFASPEIFCRLHLELTEISNCRCGATLIVTE